MEISQLYFSDLKTGSFKDMVVIHFLLLWELHTLKKGGELIGVDMVFLDEKSTWIQGTITALHFKNLLSEGVYELSVFYVARRNNHFKLCVSPVCIRFTEHTSFVEVVDLMAGIPAKKSAPPSDDMAVAVKRSMVPNPMVKSSCSDHTNGPDDVLIIEGDPARTDPEPAHTDSVMTSTETRINDEKASMFKIKLANTDHSNYGDLGFTKFNSIVCFKVPNTAI
ncbi:hypothetical protein N665_0334s0002 [Sinapis alba]|nr:hypothetical protein N665_0334s0002 [Sinapis alba]